MRIAPLLALLLLLTSSACMSDADRAAELATAAAQAAQPGCVTSVELQPAGCGSVAPPTAPPSSAGPDSAACAARGGTIRPVCRMQRPACVIAYEDAGKACTDGDQCEGRCVVLSEDATKGGVCEADSDPCGCTTELIGGVPSSICVD